MNCGSSVGQKHICKWMLSLLCLLDVLLHFLCVHIWMFWAVGVSASCGVLRLLECKITHFDRQSNTHRCEAACVRWGFAGTRSLCHTGNTGRVSLRWPRAPPGGLWAAAAWWRFSCSVCSSEAAGSDSPSLFGLDGIWALQNVLVVWCMLGHLHLLALTNRNRKNVTNCFWLTFPFLFF